MAIMGMGELFRNYMEMTLLSPGPLQLLAKRRVIPPLLSAFDYKHRSFEKKGPIHPKILGIEP